MVNSKPLEVWETELRSQVSEVDLLGEIVLTSEECHELGYLLGQLMHRRGWNAGCNIICEYYLSAFAVYLVAQGKEGYDAGAFWPAVREVTGLELHPLQATEWGQLFETAVEHLGVVSFTGLGGHRYVGPILAHGGIPINNLQEFFEYLLCPSIEDPRYAALTTHDYLEEKLERTHVHYKLSEPVLRFLQYGGNIAEDFVERCRQMAFQIASEMSTATESFGLPKAVVAHYYEWLTTRDRLLPQRRGRFRKPRLILEPWGRGLTLQFPPQEIAAQETIETVYWRIYADDTFLSEIPVELRRMEFHWRTTEESFPLSQKAAVYRVELCTADQDSSIVLCQSWCYPVLQSDLPVLTFDPEMCAFIPILHGTLPAQSLWLLYPHTAELIGEPTDSFSPAEELPPLPWDWDEFKGIYIDLTHIRRLTLQLATGDQQIICIEASRQRGQPRLEGDTLLPVADGRPPLFVGHPPYVHISLPKHACQLHRWRVTLCNEWAATLEVDFAATLQELSETLIEVDDGVLISLEASLPAGAMGNYHVTVRGPLGYAADLPFRLLPMLEMVNHDALHWSDDHEPLHLLVETLAQIAVEPQPGAQECAVTLLEKNERSALYEVRSGLQSSNAPLRFVWRDAKKEPVIVPLTVPVWRLRWQIVLAPEQALTKEWRTTPLSLPLEALEQSLQPLLFVDLFGGAIPDIEAELQLMDDNEQLLASEQARFRRGQPYARFDLRGFRDTLRHSFMPTSCINLKLREKDEKREYHYPVMTMEREFIVDYADAILQPKRNQALLRLCWDSPVRLHRRFVRLWPLWRPWNAPLEFDIPDDKLDEWAMVVPDELVYGQYCLEFGVRDPWVPQSEFEIPPTPVSPIAFMSLLPREAAFLRGRQLESAETFSEKLERALLFQSSGKHDCACGDFHWCITHLDDATLPQMVVIAQALDAEPDLSAVLSSKLAKVQYVTRAWNAWQRGEVPETLLRRYLSLLPKLPVETCEFLLTINDAGLQFKALRELLAYGEVNGIRAIVCWLQEGQLAEDDALGLLESFFTLEDIAQSQARIATLTQEIQRNLRPQAVLRVMERLCRRHPKILPAVFIRPGDWMHTIAGWGRIERIQNMDNEEQVGFCFDEATYRLEITLRAGIPYHSEQVEVDLAKRLIRFAGADQLYTCAKCYGFTTHDRENIHEHNRMIHDPNATFILQPSECLSFQTKPSYAYVLQVSPWE